MDVFWECVVKNEPVGEEEYKEAEYCWWREMYTGCPIQNIYTESDKADMVPQGFSNRGPERSCNSSSEEGSASGTELSSSCEERCQDYRDPVILFKDMIDAEISRCRAINMPVTQVFHKTISLLEWKDVCMFKTYEELNNFLRYAMIRSGGRNVDLTLLTGEPLARVKEMRKRVKNRISAKLSRKRKTEERKQLIRDNKRLKERVKVLEKELFDLRKANMLK
jgi:hypothetical protein